MDVSADYGDLVGEIPKVENELKILSVTKSGIWHSPIRIKFLAGETPHVFDCDKWAFRTFTIFRRVIRAHLGVTVNSAYDWHGRWAANKMLREELFEAMRKGGVK